MVLTIIFNFPWFAGAVWNLFSARSASWNDGRIENVL